MTTKPLNETDGTVGNGYKLLTAAMSADARPAPEPRDYQVLVVDDEACIVRIFSELLRREGYPVATALSGVQAISMARAIRPRFILMGVMMPGMNGVEAATWIKDEQPACEILFMSGNRETAPQLVEEAARRGFDFPPVLEKPFTIRELRQHIDAVYEGNGKMTLLQRFKMRLYFRFRRVRFLLSETFKPYEPIGYHPALRARK